MKVLVPLIDMHRAFLTELLLAYMQSPAINEKTIKEVDTVFRKVCNTSVVDIQDGQEILGHVMNMSEYLIQGWNWVRQKYPDYYKYSDRKILDIIKQKDEKLYLLTKLVSKAAKTIEGAVKSHYENIDSSYYIG